MRNIENLMQIIRDSQLAVPKHYHLMDQITQEDYAYFASELGVGADEKILFAIGGYNDQWVGFKRVLPLCITDKQLHITGRQSSYDVFHIPLDDIQSAKLGEKVEEFDASLGMNVDAGRPVVINGKAYALVLQDYSLYEFTSSTMIELVLGVISDEYTEQTLLDDLSMCAEGPAMHLITPFSIFSYIPLTVITCGTYPFLQMSSLYGSLKTITDKQNYPPIGSYFTALVMSVLSLGFVGLVWRKAFLDRMKQELHRRELKEGEKFSPLATWFWGLLPYVYALIVGGKLLLSKFFELPDLPKGYVGLTIFAVALVCELVYRYKLIKYMTILVDDYNMNG